MLGVSGAPLCFVGQHSLSESGQQSGTKFDQKKKMAANLFETPKAFTKYGLSWRATAIFSPPNWAIRTIDTIPLVYIWLSSFNGIPRTTGRGKKKFFPLRQCGSVPSRFQAPQSTRWSSNTLLILEMQATECSFLQLSQSVAPKSSSLTPKTSLFS